MMIESRCGIVCSTCEFQESMNCPGCVHMEKPFWGDSCQVKSCCESKGVENCGLCNSFPCEVLIGFAYDKEHGDDGARINQCNIWCKRRDVL